MSDLIEIVDHAGRVMVRMSAAELILHGSMARARGSATFYAGTFYMDRPRSREAWRAWFAARDAMRAEIVFRPHFA